MPSVAAVQQPDLTIEDAADAGLAAARANGADAADVVVAIGEAVAAQVRLGAVEEVERTEARDLGLRVFIGQSSAIVSTNDLSAGAIASLAARAVAMARAAPPDLHAGLAPSELLASSWPDLDLEDDARPDTEALVARALETEEAARAVAGVTNSLGASARSGASRFVLRTSTGFSGGYGGTRYSVSCSAVAGEGTGMQRDHDFALARHLADLEPAGEVGRRAGERAVRGVGAQRMETGPVTVVYEPRAAASLIGHLANAVNGRSVARGASFLKGRMGERLFAPGVTVTDDPHAPRGLRSRPFDGEGLAGSRCDLIADGELTTWLLDLAAARQLGLEPTGHAARSVGSSPSPSPSNLVLQPGDTEPEALIATVARGIYVTSLIGMGVNAVTGDYSRGAEGFAIENGEITGPVNEVTIAGSLADMFARLVPASDLEIRTGRDAPTVLIEGMTLAGR